MNFDKDGIRTHDLRIQSLTIVTLPAELQDQNMDTLWVLVTLFHGIETSN